MRNKLFAIIFSAIFLFMFIGAPTTLLLVKYGVLEYNNVGNEIVADKTYDESTAFGKLFTGIENGKIVIFGGGEPLCNSKGEIIGGLGVSGGTEEQDTALAEYGKQIFEKGRI